METRTHLTNQMKGLHERIMQMGTAVETALQKAINAVASRDRELAAEVVSEDRLIDALQIEIEDDCAKLIATEQPVATDLRAILTTIKFCTDLERIGDHARHLARAIDVVTDQDYREVIPLLQAMLGQGIDMLHDCIIAYVEQDAQAAIEIAKDDDKLDNLHKQLYHKILTIMRAHPDKLDEGMRVMFLGRFLERLGDHVTNMCEWVVYTQLGEHPELNS